MTEPMYHLTQTGPESYVITDMNHDPVCTLSGGNTMQIVLTYANYVNQKRVSEADLFMFGVTMGLIYGPMGGLSQYPHKADPQPSAN